MGIKWLKVCPVGLLEPWKLTREPIELFLFRFQGSHQLYLLKSQSKGKILYCKCPDMLPIYRNRLINKSAIRGFTADRSEYTFPVDTLYAVCLVHDHVKWFALKSCPPKCKIFFSPIQINYWIFFLVVFKRDRWYGLSSYFWLKKWKGSVFIPSLLYQKQFTFFLDFYFKVFVQIRKIVL